MQDGLRRNGDGNQRQSGLRPLADSQGATATVLRTTAGRKGGLRLGAIVTMGCFSNAAGVLRGERQAQRSRGEDSGNSHDQQHACAQALHHFISSGLPHSSEY